MIRMKIYNKQQEIERGATQIQIMREQCTEDSQNGDQGVRKANH